MKNWFVFIVLALFLVAGCVEAPEETPEETLDMETEEVVPVQSNATDATPTPEAAPVAKKKLIPPASGFGLVSVGYYTDFDEDMIFCNYNELARYDDTSDLLNKVPYAITVYECTDADEAREMYDDHAEFYSYDKKDATNYGDHGVESFGNNVKGVDFIVGKYFVKISGGTLDKQSSEAIVREITEAVITRLTE